MHSAVLQNKKYIKFASKNTVEVLSLSSLERGIQKGDKRAAEFEAKGPDGQPIKYMVSWPNLTKDDILKLRKTKAASYNKKGSIPQTILVNPHTLERVKYLKSRSSKGLMDEISAYQKQLIKEHGKPKLSRKDLAKIDKLGTKVQKSLGKGDWRKADKYAKKAEDTTKQWPELAKKKAATIRGWVTDFMGGELDKMEKLAASKPSNVKRMVSSMMSVLKGTDLEERAKSLLDKVTASGNE